MHKKRTIIFSLLLLSLTTFFITPVLPRAEATQKTWTFLETSMYTDYKVTVSMDDLWEVGRQYTVTLKIEVTASTNEGYLFIDSIEVGPVLNTKKEAVSVTLHVGELYTHTMMFLIIESEYGVYSAGDYPETLTLTLGGLSYYKSWTGDMDSFPIFCYESWSITMRGIEPVLSATFSSREVTQETSIDLDIGVNYPSGRGIEGCTIQVLVDSQTYICEYQGGGVYSCTIQTKDLTPGEHELHITIQKGLYYISLVESTQPVKGYTIKINPKPIPTEIIMGIVALAGAAGATVLLIKRRKPTVAAPLPTA